MKEYVDPRTSPKVVEAQVDPFTRFKYYSIDGLSYANESDKAVPVVKANKKISLTPPT